MNENLPLSSKNIGEHCYKYGSLFKVYRRENKEKARQYLEGLFHEGKHNIERMNERIEGSEYQQLHHFISVSPWDHGPVIAAIGRDISALFEKRTASVGLILDESGHRKRGKKSVGVARQYLGSIGKVDNGQVAVFAALNQGDEVAMVDARLFLPKVWAEDKKRCKKAGVPEEFCSYKTKPELGLEMIKGMLGEVCYDWIGGDSIYGNSKPLREGLQSHNLLYIMDVSEKLYFYLQDPTPYIPASKSGKGRKKSNYVSDLTPMQCKDFRQTIKEEEWQTIKIRQGTKGPLVRKVKVVDIFIWSAKKATSSNREKQRLIISCNEDGSEVKYSVTNDISLAKKQKLSNRELLYRQMERYWVERGFQNCKDALGMTDYQVRGWRAWHHHMAMTIMALQYMLEQKLIHEKEIPLLSCHDIKFFFALTLNRKANDPDQVWSLIQKRHEQRQSDLNRYK